MEGKNKNLTSSDQLQREAIAKYWKEKGPEMIINQDILKRAQQVAEQEASKGDSGPPKVGQK